MRYSKAMSGLIWTRVSTEEKRRLVEAARKRGMTLSGLIRETANAAARRIAA